MSAPKPMLFTPLKIRDVTMRNRIVISPMAMYCAENGYLNDFHSHHYAKFAMGGAGVVFVEQASVIREGRITNGCLGIWSDAHAEAMRSMVAFIKSQGSTPAIQIAHGGRKSSTQRAWEGNGPLTQKNFDNGDEAWTPVGPSSTPLAEGWLKPRALEVEEIHTLTVAF
jgi:2,4-dienoyl-CoA reductase-like NADH-dependent reductase (Old Yellow Enzyme family)